MLAAIRRRKPFIYPKMHQKSKKKKYSEIFEEEDEKEDYDDNDLEKQILQTYQEYQSSVIRNDALRNETRKKRRRLFEIQKSLLLKKNILDSHTKSCNLNNNPQIQEQMKLHEEINQLKHKIALVQEQLESRSDLEQYYTEKIHMLKSKQQCIENRKQIALSQLSNPLDTIEPEESAITDLEKEILMLQAQLREKPKEKESNFSQFNEALQKLEEHNENRRIELISRQAEIDAQLKRMHLNNAILPTRANEQFLTFQSSSSRKIDKDGLQKMIKQMSLDVRNRYERLRAESREIEKAEAANKREREKIENKWNVKVERIGKLNALIRESESKSSILSDLKSSIEREKSELACACEKAKAIHRRIDNIKRDKDYNSEKNKEHRELLEKLNLRKRDLERVDDILQKKKKEIVDLDDSIAELEHQYSEYSTVIEEKENEVLKFERENKQRLKELGLETDEFEQKKQAFLAQGQPAPTLGDMIIQEVEGK